MHLDLYKVYIVICFCDASIFLWPFSNPFKYNKENATFKAVLAFLFAYKRYFPAVFT